MTHEKTSPIRKAIITGAVASGIVGNAYTGDAVTPPAVIKPAEPKPWPQHHKRDTSPRDLPGEWVEGRVLTQDKAVEENRVTNGTAIA